MDPTTSTSEQFKRYSEDFFKRFQALEQENENLKLKILQLETKERIENDDEENKNLKLKIIELTQELEKKEERENNCVCRESQDEQTHEKIRMSGSVMPVSSEGVDTPFQDILVDEEPDDELIPEDIPLDTQSMDNNQAIDIREDDICYGVSNSRSDMDNPIPDSVPLDSLNDYQSSQIPTNFERDLGRSANADLDSAGGTDRDLNHSSKRKKCQLPKVPQICFICNKICATERVLTNQKKTHNGEESAMVELPAKRSLPSEIEEVNSARLPLKKRKIVCETEVRNDEEMPRVRDAIVPPSSGDERNPFTHKDCEEILKRILSNLGRNDLLNARLVSHAWNDESLKVLRKSNFTQLLTERNIGTYIRFTTSNEPRPFIIPFHLDFRISLSSKNSNMFTPIPRSDVDSLCQMFGPQCVSTLTLNTLDTDWTETEANMKEIGLIECLALISPGLKTLDLQRFYTRIDFLKHQVINFPILTKLICNALDCKSGRSGPGLTYISIIENSQILEDLTLICPCDMDSWPLNFNRLKSLSIDQMIKPQNILDKILSSSGLPVLRELSIGLMMVWNAEQTSVVYAILKSVSTTLKSLKFYGYSLGRNTGNLRFPKLPHLEHFGLEYDFGNKCRLDPNNIDFSPENFPSLKSIELPIGFIFAPLPVQPQFPNFNKLALRVSKADEPEVVNGPLEDLQQIFPTPSKLCLVNTGGYDFVKYVLYRIMKSNWSKNIQQIEMIGFRRDDLAQMLFRWEFTPLVGLGEWYRILKVSLKTEFQSTMQRIRLEFEEVVVDTFRTFILRRRCHAVNCPNSNST